MSICTKCRTGELHYKGIETDCYTFIKRHVFVCDSCNTVFKENVEKGRSEHVETERGRSERERKEMEDWENRRQTRQSDKEWDREYDWMSKHY